MTEQQGGQTPRNEDAYMAVEERWRDEGESVKQTHYLNNEAKTGICFLENSRWRDQQKA